VTTRHSLDRSLWPAVGLLVAAFALFEFTSIDIWLQDLFYNHSTKKWLVDSKEPIQRLLFYTGPKALIWVFAGTIIGLCLVPKKFRARFSVGRRELLIVIATLTTAPALVALSKATTNVFCPYELTRYDGNYAYKKVCETYGPNERPINPKGKPARGRGFPAGHASGGFALLSLAGLATTRKGRAIGIMIGLGMGTWMGVYQMLKGAHFLSHTIITAIFCWIVFLLWRRVSRRYEKL
jgi:membrane-associated PAP2 superfamily phosphatase